MRKKYKLGVVVPYRHRENQIQRFIFSITSYLDKQEIPHEIIIIEQDDGKQFNRGALLNIGFLWARKLNCKYVVFHDIDMIPIDVDYNYSTKPIHLATGFTDKNREIFDQYFGGVTLFPIYDFKMIDGYSNKYWDWGYEDDDLLFRCKTHGVELNKLKIKNTGKPKKALKFNGVDSYVKFRNIFDLDDDLTFLISFYPDDILCDYLKDNDYYTVFSIPGYDTSISFNSFSRYNFCTFDEDRNALYINSKIKTNYKTNICVTIDNKKKVIRAFQDGVFIGETNFTKRLLSYTYERFSYLGVGEPNRSGDERYFKGYITNFIVFNKVLLDVEITEITNNETNDFRQNFGEYSSSESILIYYDAEHIERYKLVDLSGNNHHGTIEKCEIIDLDYPEYKSIMVPNRRESLFEVLPHEENGFIDNKWKNKATRWNQLKYYNEVLNDSSLIKNDGLSTLEYIEHGVIVDKNVTIVNIGL
jgi:hypothetical protein